MPSFPIPRNERKRKCQARPKLWRTRCRNSLQHTIRPSRSRVLRLLKKDRWRSLRGELNLFYILFFSFKLYFETCYKKAWKQERACSTKDRQKRCARESDVDAWKDHLERALSRLELRRPARMLLNRRKCWVLHCRPNASGRCTQD